jgi:hypothetical protein
MASGSSGPTSCAVEVTVTGHLSGLWGGEHSLTGRVAAAVQGSATGSHGFTAGAGTCTLTVTLSGDIDAKVPASAYANLSEQKPRRGRRRIVAAWGSGTEYTRLVRCAEGNLETELGGNLALGSLLPQIWADYGLTVTSGPEQPRLQAVDPIEQPRDSADRVIRLTYLAVDVSTQRAGYMETKRTNPRRKTQFADEIETWGISHMINSRNIPEQGDYLTTGSTPRRAICVSVEISTKPPYGRFLVHAVWQSLRQAYLLEV